MNKFYSIIVFLGLSFPILSQSYFKASINTTRFITELSQKSIGIGGSFGYQFIIGKNDFLKFVTGQSLELKRAPFSYYSGGLGGGTTTTGTINFINLKIDMRARIQGDFFADLGVFTALTLHDYITKGKDISSQYCLILPNVNCIPVTEGSPTNHFERFDWGISASTGYHFKHFSLSLDTQIGLYKVVALHYSTLKSSQFNLNFELPMSYFKTIKNK